MRWVSLWAPVVASMIGLFLASEQRAFPGVERFSDKLLHAVAYALLGVLCLRACHGGFRPLRVAPTLIALALTLSYGLIDELHQSWVPGRVPSTADWLADAAGAIVAIPIAGLIGVLRMRRTAGAEGSR